jgi:sugar fermentation stimulation protein A
MLLPQPMAHGRLVQRYKRFFADVVVDGGEALTAHCPNPGAMLGLNAPGLGVWLSRSDKPTRKLAWTLELVEADGGLVGVNTTNPPEASSDSHAPRSWSSAVDVMLKPTL